jgi:hypothetical protein
VRDWSWQTCGPADVCRRGIFVSGEPLRLPKMVATSATVQTAKYISATRIRGHCCDESKREGRNDEVPDYFGFITRISWLLRRRPLCQHQRLRPCGGFRRLCPLSGSNHPCRPAVQPTGRKSVRVKLIAPSPLPATGGEGQRLPGAHGSICEHLRGRPYHSTHHAAGHNLRGRGGNGVPERAVTQATTRPRLPLPRRTCRHRPSAGRRQSIPHRAAVARAAADRSNRCAAVRRCARRQP